MGIHMYGQHSHCYAHLTHSENQRLEESSKTPGFAFLFRLSHIPEFGYDARFKTFSFANFANGFYYRPEAAI